MKKEKEVRKCEICDDILFNRGSLAKYCKRCARFVRDVKAEVRRKRIREAREMAEKKILFKKICKRCKKPIIGKKINAVYCKECVEIMKQK